MSVDRTPHIELRGVRVHNLQNIDLDIPLGKLIVVAGVSGSGKSSLAFDTLYAEGQRRYVESFSTYARRFLDRFEKPDADRIEPIPPAVAVRQRTRTSSRRATVGTVTEIYDLLRLVFARAGTIVCPACHFDVARQSPASARIALNQFLPDRKLMVCFAPVETAGAQQPLTEVQSQLVRDRLLQLGLTRAISKNETIDLRNAEQSIAAAGQPDLLVVVDRLTVGAPADRLHDSLELAQRYGSGSFVILVEQPDDSTEPGASVSVSRRMVDRRCFETLWFSDRLICPGCRREFPDAEPALFNFNSPLGACPTCRGLGVVASSAEQKPGNTVCSSCDGARLRSDALAVRLGIQHAGRSIAELARLTAGELTHFVKQIRNDVSDETRQRVDQPLRRIETRLDYLREVGLEYLTLDRSLRSLSTGEAQRVRLTAALGSNLVETLYILDEPTAGLHPNETERLIDALRRLRNAGNTLVVVEHDSAVIRAADEVIDLGPGAGKQGGRIVYQGPADALAAVSESTTAEWVFRKSPMPMRCGEQLRTPTGWLKLTGVQHRNLNRVSVEFPLGVLCAVVGVSGSGKSSLVEETLYPALVDALRKNNGNSEIKTSKGLWAAALCASDVGQFDSISGVDQLDAVLQIDQTPIARSGRGNPATLLNLFGEIRSLFAETAEAKVHNLTPAHFSFNVSGGGRCETCQGGGTISVDMQFLPDVATTCPDCHGARFRKEILEARYRGLSIAQVLEMTTDEAFAFFRGKHRLQRRLKVLKDVGLGYITLGQSTNALSGGETQRLKLASFLGRGTRARTLFVIEEPTIGLHSADVERLIDVLGQIVAAGHSVIAIEHHLDFLAQADYLIEMGPGAGPQGGQVTAFGPPAEVVNIATSITGRLLAQRE